jgi:hypothetical protein
MNPSLSGLGWQNSSIVLGQNHKSWRRMARVIFWVVDWRGIFQTPEQVIVAGQTLTLYYTQIAPMEGFKGKCRVLRGESGFWDFCSPTRLERDQLVFAVNYGSKKDYDFQLSHFETPPDW